MLSGSNLHLLYGEDRWGHPREDSTGGEEMLFLTGRNQSLGNEPLLFLWVTSQWGKILGDHWQENLQANIYLSSDPFEFYSSSSLFKTLAEATATTLRPFCSVLPKSHHCFP